MISLALNDRVKVVAEATMFGGEIGYIADIRAGWLIVQFNGRFSTVPFRFHELELFEVGQ
jgi:hypothetical protein